MKFFQSTRWIKLEGGIDFPSCERLRSMPGLYAIPIIQFFVVTGLTIFLKDSLFGIEHVNKNVFDYFSGIIIACSLVCSAAWGFYLRRDRIRSAQNHTIYHNIRDAYILKLQKFRSIRSTKWDGLPSVILNDFFDLATELLAEHFRELCRNKNVGSAIRVQLHDGNLATVGRSKALRHRMRSTEKVNVAEGLPKAIREQGYTRAAIIRDINFAESEGFWKKDENCKEPSIRSVIALPINMKLEDPTPVFLGILYITSPHSGIMCPFRKRSAEQACGFADALAVHLYGFIEATILKENNSPRDSALKKLSKRQTKNGKLQ